MDDHHTMLGFMMVMWWYCCCSLSAFHVQAITTTHNISKEEREADTDVITSLLIPTCRRLMNSRKYQSDCMARPSVVYPLLVTGLGGSGTHAVSQQLRDRGVHVGHEEIEIDGSVVRTNTIFINHFVFMFLYSDLLSIFIPVLVLCRE